ncbi:MAG: hypothetical protein ABWZ82_01645 [Candidatus Limnocylindrales bacterium]
MRQGGSTGAAAIETALITAEDLAAGDRLTLVLPPGQGLDD